MITKCFTYFQNSSSWKLNLLWNRRKSCRHLSFHPVYTSDKRIQGWNGKNIIILGWLLSNFQLRVCLRVNFVPISTNPDFSSLTTLYLNHLTLNFWPYNWNLAKVDSVWLFLLKMIKNAVKWKLNKHKITKNMPCMFRIQPLG